MKAAASISFVKVMSFALRADGSVERRFTEVPAIVNPSPVVVRILDGTDKREALRLLRRFLKELEATP